jgi:hypothetical protein
MSETELKQLYEREKSQYIRGMISPYPFPTFDQWKVEWRRKNPVFGELKSVSVDPAISEDLFTRGEIEIAYCLGLINKKGQGIDELSEHIKDVQDNKKVEQLIKFILDRRKELKAAEKRVYSRWDFRWSQLAMPWQIGHRYAVEHPELGRHVIEMEGGITKHPGYPTANDIYEAIGKKLNITIE